MLQINDDSVATLHSKSIDSTGLHRQRTKRPLASFKYGIKFIVGELVGLLWKDSLQSVGSREGRATETPTVAGIVAGNEDMDVCVRWGHLVVGAFFAGVDAIGILSRLADLEL